MAYTDWHDWKINNTSIRYTTWHSSTVALDFTADLNHYFENEVRLRKTNIEKSLEITFPIVNTILEYINQRDPRFSHKRVGVGSYWQGLKLVKVEKPDEFDISVPLNCPSGHELVEDTTDAYFQIDPWDDTQLINTATPLPPPPPGYIRCLAYQLGLDPEWMDFVFDDYFIPMFVRNKFKELLREAVWTLDETGRVSFIT